MSKIVHKTSSEEDITFEEIDDHPVKAEVIDDDTLIQVNDLLFKSLKKMRS